MPAASLRNGCARRDFHILSPRRVYNKPPSFWKPPNAYLRMAFTSTPTTSPEPSRMPMNVPPEALCGLRALMFPGDI